MSVQETDGVEVKVVPEFLPGESDPVNGFWFHIYHVTIMNRSKKTVQLISRHWIITSGDGEQEHVRGPGVVGEQPVLKPGESFRYTSGCPLHTSFGAMHGSYQMVDEDGRKFDAVIAPFDLSEPNSIN